MELCSRFEGLKGFEALGVFPSLLTEVPRSSVELSLRWFSRGRQGGKKAEKGAEELRLSRRRSFEAQCAGLERFAFRIKLRKILRDSLSMLVLQEIKK